MRIRSSRALEDTAAVGMFRNVPSLLLSEEHPRQDPMTPLRPINETWESGLIDDNRLNVVAPQIG